MKILDTAKITDVARIVSFVATLAYMVVLFIRIIIPCIIAVTRIYIHHHKLGLWYPYAQKRVIQRFNHDRKHSLFAGIPDATSNSIREMETRFIGK